MSKTIFDIVNASVRTAVIQQPEMLLFGIIRELQFMQFKQKPETFPKRNPGRCVSVWAGVRGFIEGEKER